MRPTLPIPLFIVAFAIAVAACDAPTTREASDAPPLFDDFGSLHRDIDTDVAAAQRYFDQGLRMTYGFNHEAAGRAFAEAARLDPACAMCAWGQALVLGPNINMPMDPAQAAEARRLADAALALKSHATDADRALIEALATRYADPAPEDRASLDRAYADAMADAYRRFPADDDIATLYGEALMDLSPWVYWEADGAPGANTPAILGAFEAVLARNPAHIGAAHYYIHAVEASPDPGRAERHADLLGTLAPGSGHLVHMPAHVYIRVGRYHDATLSNFAATSADEAFLSVCRGSNGVYPLGYVPHNWHFATLTAGLHGSSTLALQAAAQTARRADPAQLDAMSFMQQFVVAPLMTQVRFGRWDEILATAGPPAEATYPTAIWHFARGMARVRTGALDQARTDLEALRAAAADPAMAGLVLWDINGADRVLAVAEAMLRGELALAAGDREGGIAALREAAAVEDGLNYNEPADWPLPIRPYLGAALLEAGRAADAAAVYREDLVTYPENGWSLRGLALAEQARGDAAAANAARRRFDNAWQWADVDLVASRF
ncbi:hypothetical protein [Marilutibacter aestuarii]|uniref:Tetratricopeptide repeat protein n=1 Tax=Marilutibacter aestuarii TaxID=1706195 RepID=A0A508ARK0_9GAMM|nr:hypothetical protein [Lysobacter aestuarii]TQD49745.1 hypothetical protein FKV25_03975 [Lysobacter aestuarii]